jgi:hypothetical protein
MEKNPTEMNSSIAINKMFSSICISVHAQDVEHLVVEDAQDAEEIIVTVQDDGVDVRTVAM